MSVASAAPAEFIHPWDRENVSGVFLDVGAGWMRTNRNGVTYRAQYLRFAPQISINRWFYLGAAFEVGRIYSSSGMLDGMLPVPCTGGPGMCTGPGNNLVDETSGTISEPQVIVGVRDLIGPVSGSFEVAPTVRWTTGSTNFLNQSFTTSVTTIELHAHADVWATSHVTAGIMLGSDINTVRNVQAGVQIGFHFESYDGMNHRGPSSR